MAKILLLPLLALAIRVILVSKVFKVHLVFKDHLVYRVFKEFLYKVYKA